MKKTGCNIILLIFIYGFLAACSKKELSFNEKPIDFNTIEVSDSTTGNQVTLDEEKSKELYNKIRSIDFIKDKSSDNATGWRYSITFKKESKEVEKIFIIDDNTIDYNYEAGTKNIDTDYLNMLFEVNFEATVIEIDPSLIVMPNSDSNEFKSSDKFVVNSTDRILNVEGEEISVNDLRVGDLVDIIYNGVIMESYPAQISCYRIQVKEESLLKNGYMALIDDIYQDDAALNSDISILAIDTAEMTNITENEKQRLFIKLQDIYDLEVVEGTFDELVEKGLIDKANLFFEKGVLIKIKKPIYDEKKKRLKCGIEKWRSGLGAIGSDDVTVQYDGTTWKITKNGMWIS